jgi:hypothetical protein
MQYHYWTVIGEGPTIKSHEHKLCRCKCGKARFVTTIALEKGESKSCGCLRIERLVVRQTTHGDYGTPTYRSWISMLNRCENTKHPHYSRYGGRGLTVQQSWHDYNNFKADMGSCPDNYTIDRIDNDKGYSKENCRWCTMQENLRNRKQTLLFRGRQMFRYEIAKELGLSERTLYERLKQYQQLTLDQIYPQK